MSEQGLIPHLFRTEYRKIVSVLSKRFGFEHVEVAEDIAGETFLTAVQSWGPLGLPPNPVAWLYTVAKNKAKNYLARTQRFATGIAPELARQLDQTHDADIDLSPQNIIDSQLQMMFVVCHPSVAKESQVALALRLLCGFSIEEIADAFLTTKETINKRLLRAREKLRQEHIAIVMPEENEIEGRIDAVLMTLYLLFNEGYSSRSNDKSIRAELCLEAMRLCSMLVEQERSDRPNVNALLSLMCFHASRLNARRQDGEAILYQHQDTSLWNTDLIARGTYFLRRASSGTTLSRYHIEAGIAYWHTIKTDTPEKWENILLLHNRLLQIEYSPVAALNRGYAFAKVHGCAAAIIEVEKLRLHDSHFYFALLGELYKTVDQSAARAHFQTARDMVKSPADQRALQKEIDGLTSDDLTFKGEPR